MKQILIFLVLLFVVSLNCDAEETRAVSILLDVSRSLKPADFEKTKATVQQWLDQDHSNLGSLYTFGSNMEKITREQLTSTTATESFTSFNDAAYDAMQDLTKQSADKKALIIFSDGNDTRSATTIEDIVALAKENRIAIHCVGTGKANEKLLQRISKLTGGTFFRITNPEIIRDLNDAIASQELSHPPQVVQPPPIPVKPSVVAPPTTAIPKASEVPVQEPERGTSLLKIALIAATVLVICIIGFFAFRRKEQIRTCPTCGKVLESYQTICPECPGQTKILSVAQIAEDLKQAEESSSQTAPPEWYDLKQETMEIMAKTTYLKETPILVVTKGTNLGESYELSSETPISIGRSRINEIRPYDGSISAQHCRIIPENGRHVLYDLGSTNGTMLNQRKVTKAILKEGDTIELGETILQYKIEHTH